MTESVKLDQRVKLFESFSSLDALTLGPSLRDSITKGWPEIERLSHIFCCYTLYVARCVSLGRTLARPACITFPSGSAGALSGQRVALGAVQAGTVVAAVLAPFSSRTRCKAKISVILADFPKFFSAVPFSSLPLGTFFFFFFFFYRRAKLN